MHDRRTIEQIGGFVTVHASLPPDVLRWTVAMARREGHKDVSLVIIRALKSLKEQAKARLREP